MPDATPEIEAAARVLAEKHFAVEFNRPAEHPLVAANIEARWSEFVEQAEADAARAAEKAAAAEEKKAK